jgi:2-polyprenyl-6-methoxyphenol hydroxylase-like FAD-dependent oxidoreductase
MGYTYWHDVARRARSTRGQGGRSVPGRPDRLTLTYLAWPVEEFPRPSADVEANALRTDLAGDLGEGVRAGRRAERFRARPDLRSFIRRPFGPGWALVGDAGLVMDPITGQGIGDALRDAELLAEAVEAGLGGRRPLAGTLADYERARDRAALACTSSPPTWPPPRQRRAAGPVGALRAAREIGRFLGVLTGAVPMADYFRPRSLLRVLGVRGLASMALRGRRPAAVG